MKLIIQSSRIAATATDDYTGPDEFIPAPDGFDINRMGDYVIEAGVAVLPAPGVPTEVTMRQACLALEGAGLLDDVEAIVATLPRVYQIEWQRASTVLRSNPLVEMVRQQNSMTEAQIDTLFVTAASL